MAISMDDWRAELERVLAGRNDEGMSARELADAMQVSTRTVGERIRVLAAQGRLIVGFRREASVVGHMKKVPVYRIKKK